jgi:hypothetical protein
MDDAIPKRHVFIENGELIVRVNTIADHRLALRELKLLKRELRIQRRVAAAEARAEISNARQAGMSKHRVLMAVQVDVAESAVRALDAKIQVVELMELKIEASILQLQFK